MFTDPEKNVMEFGFIPGQKVADFGSGAGHYSNALSQTLGPTGRVYAIDLNADLLAKLKNNAVKEARGNIEIIWGDVEKPHGTKLKDSAVDGAVLSNILFQLDDKKSVIDEAKRIVRPGGKIAIVEWADLSFLENSLKGQNKQPTGAEETKGLFAAMGLTFERSFEAGEHHYGLIFKKPLQ